MRVLITSAQFGLGGTESYAVTVAEHLERLGHPTRLHTAKATPAGRELAAARGLELSVGDEALAEQEVDAVLAQDVASAYRLATREGLRRAFVIHGFAPFEHPPNAGKAPPLVVLNDRTAARATALAAAPRTLRLRQPIDIERFRPRRPARPRAERVLVLSNALPAERLRLLAGVCAELGLELVRVGGDGAGSVAPEEAIAGADVVIGYGRSVLEAMAMGKAAYVWERAGGDGWVTPETYPAFEADGFSGAASGTAIGAERLRADLAAYDPELGTLGYDLVRMHHTATKHAEALVGLLEGEDGAAVSGEQLEALALMVRSEARTANRLAGLERECEQLHEALAGEREGRLAAEGQLAALLGSWSWRLTAPLRRFGARRRAGEDAGERPS